MSCCQHGLILIVFFFHYLILIILLFFLIIIILYFYKFASLVYIHISITKAHLNRFIIKNPWTFLNNNYGQALLLSWWLIIIITLETHWRYVLGCVTVLLSYNTLPRVISSDCSYYIYIWGLMYVIAVLKFWRS